jgi:hypothetical protein
MNIKFREFMGLVRFSRNLHGGFGYIPIASFQEISFIYFVYVTVDMNDGYEGVML